MLLLALSIPKMEIRLSEVARDLIFTVTHMHEETDTNRQRQNRSSIEWWTSTKQKKHTQENPTKREPQAKSTRHKTKKPSPTHTQGRPPHLSPTPVLDQPANGRRDVLPPGPSHLPPPAQGRRACRRGPAPSRERNQRCDWPRACDGRSRSPARPSSCDARRRW